MKLNDQDRAAIEALVFDPKLQPDYEEMKGCLVWSDEQPEAISSAGYELVCDLWIVRLYIHLGLPPSEWGLDPTYFGQVWNETRAAGLRWPGFNRLELSEEDRAMLLSRRAYRPSSDEVL